jgi:hypothetical protein
MVERTRRDLPVAYRASAQLQELESENPGFLDYFIARMLPDAERRVKERTVRMSSQMTAWLSANLADADLTAILAFYQGPVGTKVIGLLRQMSLVPLAQSIGAKVSTGDVRGADMQNGAAATIAANGGLASRLTPADLAEVMRFLATDAGQKWKAVQPAFYTEMANFLNKEAQGALPAIRTETAAVIADYKREHPKKAPL